MSLEQIFRRFWWVFLLAFIFVWQNLRRKAKIKATRRRSLAKARKVKAAGVSSTQSSSGGSRSTTKPKKTGKRKNLSKKAFLALMAKGRAKAARARAKAGG